jgi:hypothetical protein
MLFAVMKMQAHSQRTMSASDQTLFFDPTPRTPGQRVVLICDWLPPDFGAVGQYSLQRAEQLAAAGHHITLVGFSSTQGGILSKSVGKGTLKIIYIKRNNYKKTSLFKRAFWTLGANIALLWAARKPIRASDEVIFTGSPPYLLHFIAPVNLFWKKKIVYRITDFHPECLMAEYQRPPLWLKLIYWQTLFWRRRVPMFEVIGEDQRHRLSQINIGKNQVRLVRDPAPIAFATSLIPKAKPTALENTKTILYSGNFGVAHDHQTFMAGYREFQQKYPQSATLWLNAVGKKADLIENICIDFNLPIFRSQPVPLPELAALLISIDLHLVTLRDEFVGFVLPSKIYACIDSGKPILFIGSDSSDVHLLCTTRMKAEHYRRVNVGDHHGVFSAIEALLKI